MSNESHIYTGFWTDWSRGRIAGATLTLPQRYGGPLAAFLAIFVSITGTSFWKVLRFLLHHQNTTKPGVLKDALHQQRQVVLRNSGSPAGAVLDFAWLAFSWSRWARRPFARTIGFALLAALNLAAFSVAGIFTSEVTTVPGNSTLIRGPSCGGWETNASNNNTPLAFASKILSDTLESATYVRQCYGDTGGLECNTFYRPRLQYTVDRNATCPFASGLCLFNDQSAYAMDSGRIDSHTDLGINARKDYRVQYRRVATCAPIHAKPFSQVLNNTDGDEVVRVYAGPSQPFPYTFEIDVHTTYVNRQYGLRAAFAVGSPPPSAGDPNWQPDPSLKRTDADVSLFVLTQNLVNYQAPSDDPWMPAHLFSDPYWLGDGTLHLMACIDQYQICNPNKAAEGPKACTSLTGLWPIRQELGKISLNDQQTLTALRILQKVIAQTMFFSVSGRGGSALNAAETLNELIQSPIPPTQWHKEVSIWFAITLARLQAFVVEWAVAPKNLAPGSGLYAQPVAFASEGMCRNQFVRNTGSYQSFSVLGLALILIIGALIILAGSTIDIAVGHFQKGRTSEYRRRQWILEDKLQLQRMAYEAFGFGGKWEGRFDNVPTIAQPHKRDKSTHDESAALISSSSELYDAQERRDDSEAPEEGGGRSGTV